MTPTLIVLALLALGVGIVAFATRRSSTRPTPARNDQDTAWNDPITPASGVAPDPLSHALEVVEPTPAPAAAPTREPSV
jgi:hypothetical protein